MALARAHVVERVDDHTGRPVNGATVTVREPGLASPVGQVLYAAATGATTVANPIVTDEYGNVDFWVANRQEVDLFIQTPANPGGTTRRVSTHLRPDQYVATDGDQTIAGAKTFTNLIATGGTLSGITVSIPNGSAGAPGLPLLNSPTTGLYRAGSNMLGVSVNGVARVETGVDYARFLPGAVAAILVDAGDAGAGYAPPSRSGDEHYAPLMVEAFLANPGGDELAGIWSHALLDSGANGYAAGVKGQAEVPVGSTFTGSGENGIIGVLGLARQRSSATNLMTRGGNFIAEVYAGTGGKGIGVEIDVMSQVALSERMAVIVSAVRSPDTAHAHADPNARDYGIWFANKAKNSQFPKGWLAGIMFGRPSVGAIPGATEGIMFPVDTVGALIKADSRNLNGAGTATYGCAVGIDFENLVTTSFQLLLKGVAIDPSGDISFTVDGRKIRGNFHDGTLGNRILFQTLATGTGNNPTYLGVVPVGTSTASGIVLYNSAAPVATGLASIAVAGAAAALNTGSGVTSWAHQVNGTTMLTVAAGLLTLAGAHVDSSILTPSPQPTSGTVSDWSPTGLASARTINVTPSAGAVSLTGIAAPAVAGTKLRLVNNSGFVITLKHEQTSTTTNRFYLPGLVDYPIAGAGVANLVYINSRWFLDQ